MNISSKFAVITLLFGAADSTIAADLDPPVLGAEINSDFGLRIATVTPAGPSSSKHQGIDYLLEKGISIQSIERSSISLISYTKERGWFIEATSIEHPERKWIYTKF